MDLQLLRKFCGIDVKRPALRDPWTQGQYTYASDGRIVVRVPKLAAYPPVVRTVPPPNAAYVFDSYPAKGNYVTLPALPKKKVLNPDARECTLIEHRKFDGYYIRLVIQLPLVRFSLSAYGVTDPMPFKFEGGEGLLMPLRYDSSIVTLELRKGTHWKQFQPTKIVSKTYEKEAKEKQSKNTTKETNKETNN
jgi:hypothetical protein